MTEISMRRVDFAGVEELMWVTEDRGAFSGPLKDWKDDHEEFVRYVRSFDTVIQAGGNCGMYARFYADYFKTVITIEPDDLNYQCLDINCQGDQYRKFHAALGEARGNGTLKPHSLTNCGMHRMTVEPGVTPFIRIDDICTTSCDLIHLDIEGFEPYALLGGLETIETFSPVIILERSCGEDVIRLLGYDMVAKLRMDSVYVRQ